MNSEQSEANLPSSPRNIFDIVIRLAALVFLLYWSFRILEPFIGLILWSTILAVSLFPLFRSLTKKMNGKKGLAATIIVVLLLALIIAPTIWLMVAAADDVTALRNKVSEEGIVINPPPESVKGIPIIGNKLDQVWTSAAANFHQFLQENKERIKNIVLRFFGLVSSTAKGILLLAAAIIVSGVLMCYGEQAGNLSKSFFVRLVGKGGESMASIAEVTIRNVTRGILGVAVIQSLLAGIGMVIGGVPFAGVWTLLWLMFAIVQIPALPVAIGVIIWVWNSDTGTGMAVVLTIWMLVAGLIDNVLKPIMLGKGAPVPMLVVFLGAIGGFIFTGFTGLFTGAIVLSLAYQLFIEWLSNTDTGN